MTQTFQLGPPFGGAYFEPPSRGAWAAARAYGNTGQVVLQLGGQPPRSPDPLVANAGFDFDIPPITASGIYGISASVAVGPVSMLPRGFSASTSIQIAFDLIPDAESQPLVFKPPPQGVIGAKFGVYTLAFQIHLTGTPDRPSIVFLTLGVTAVIDYTGSPSQTPYAEMICTFKNVVETFTPDSARVSAALAAQRPEHPRRVRRELTEREMAKEGAIVFTSD
jgi:hypothetical protein